MELQANAQINKIEAKIDRVVFASFTRLGLAQDKLGDFRTDVDRARFNTNDGFHLAPYGRFRRIICDRSRTRLLVEYNPRFPRMAPVRAAVVPDDPAGLCREELEALQSAFSPCQLRKLEIALDFEWSTGVDAKFVKRHGKFGKARPRPNRQYPHAAWAGVPKAQWFARSYPKKSINRFRVEVQLNRKLIEKYALDDLGNWEQLPEIVSRHVGFFEVSW